MNRAQRRALARQQKAARPAREQRRGDVTLLQRKLVALVSASPEPLADDARNRVLDAMYSAIESVACGSAPGTADWNALADAINYVWTLALRGTFDRADVEPTVNVAVEAMVEAHESEAAGRGLRMSESGLQAMREVVGLYRLALFELSECEMALVVVETNERVRRETARHVAQQVQPGDRIVRLGSA